jgi:hypothetical protein
LVSIPAITSVRCRSIGVVDARSTATDELQHARFFPGHTVQRYQPFQVLAPDAGDDRDIGSHYIGKHRDLAGRIRAHFAD